MLRGRGRPTHKGWVVAREGELGRGSGEGGWHKGVMARRAVSRAKELGMGQVCRGLQGQYCIGHRVRRLDVSLLLAGPSFEELPFFGPIPSTCYHFD